MKDEIDTQPIITSILESGKPLFIPAIEGEELVFYQTRCDSNDPAQCGYSARVLNAEDFPALIITPGLAFDRKLNRLGRGRSYYDRFFAVLDKSKKNYAVLGLCMDCQIFDEVPADTWDKKVDMLLTESGLFLPP
jgi:5-formyltetrahydrofolate cyclo-ligase